MYHLSRRPKQKDIFCLENDGEDKGKQEFVIWKECELAQPLERATGQY